MQGIKQHKENFFHSRFWIVVLVIISVILGLAVFRVFKKFRHAKTIRNEYQAELNQVRQSQAQLEKNIEALSTDRGKEAEIRDRYRVVKQGEQMIVIVDNAGETTETTPEKPIGFFRKIVLFFQNL